ncbi:MAG: AAA family ATPase [Chitinophagales bacterium]|jgi:MoxR-like ATPase|nr:AAA family ATPase [Chitinophagales bacterium]
MKLENKNTKMRQFAEDLFVQELDALREEDKKEVKPQNWNLSPKAVKKFIMGGQASGVEISQKYMGDERLVEIAIATLLTDSALLLVGEPGTAKSWLSENLCAAICGDAKKVIQGTAGTIEEHLKYSWNYALLIANGPNMDSLIKSPIYNAMETGTIARFEELSRCVTEIQDAMISILSEKNIAIPELNTQVYAQKGFSIIATANTRDMGIHDMSSALKRRFNTVYLPLPKSIDDEVEIVTKRAKNIAHTYQIQADIPAQELIKRVVTIFRELRQGHDIDKKVKFNSMEQPLSTAEAISVITGSMAMSACFGSGQVNEKNLAISLHTTLIKNNEEDSIVWVEYLRQMNKRNDDWKSLHAQCLDLCS